MFASIPCNLYMLSSRADVCSVIGCVCPDSILLGSDSTMMLFARRAAVSTVETSTTLFEGSGTHSKSINFDVNDASFSKQKEYSPT